MSRFSITEGSPTDREPLLRLRTPFGSLEVPITDASSGKRRDGQDSLMNDYGAYPFTEVSRPFTSLEEVATAYNRVLSIMSPTVVMSGGVPHIIRHKPPRRLNVQEFPVTTYFIEPLDSVGSRFLEECGFGIRDFNLRSYIDDWKNDWGDDIEDPKIVEQYADAVSALIDICDNAYEILTCFSTTGTLRRPVSLTDLAPELPEYRHVPDNLLHFSGVDPDQPALYYPSKEESPDIDNMQFIYPGLADEPFQRPLERVARAAHAIYRLEGIPSFEDDGAYLTFMEHLLEAHQGLPLWMMKHPELVSQRTHRDVRSFATVCRAMEILEKSIDYI